MPQIGHYSHVYYSTLKCNNPDNIFANEIEKKKFLDFVNNMRKDMEFEVYAYCVMDDEAHLLVGADNARMLCQVLMKLQREFNTYYKKSYPGYKNRMTETHSKLNKETAEQVLEYCGKIHLLPFVEKVVQQLGDYWWSSYKDYLGKYNSGIVDTGVLMDNLDPDKQSAIRKFRIYHRKQFQMLS